MRAWGVLRQLLTATLCALLVAPAYPSESTLPRSSSTPSPAYDAETLSKTRVWGSNEKILLHFRATLVLSEKQHWGYAKCSWKNVVGSVVTYDYDAFGNLIHSTGTSYNNYLFAGEQFDPDLNLYYNRARYLNTSTGRFWSMDSYEGDSRAPLSLHKYLYSNGDPMNRIDPSGNDGDLATLGAEEDVLVTENTIETEEELGQTILEGPPPTPAPPTVGPPPTIPNAPVPVSYGSVIGRAVVFLTALGLAGSQVSDNPLPPTQPRTGDEGFVTVYRDAGGPSPSDFNPDQSQYSTTGWGLSLRQQPQRNKKYIVPFMVTYNPNNFIGVVSDPVFVSCLGSPLPIVFSPSEGPGGHWTLQAPADPAGQADYKQSLRDYARKVKLDASSPTP